ncbi:MAG: thioredoxin family protein [Sphingobacteriia bacterium]|jgi:thiol:disulfide interchange protein
MKYLVASLLSVCLIGVLSFKPIEKLSNKNGEVKTAAAGISFIEGDWKKALAKAKAEKKLIFVDAYATWCGPCKKLQKDVFPDAAVGTYFNKNFINITIDVEQGQGIEFAQKYGVEVLPTLYITDENGNPITYTKGYMSASDLLKFGQFGIQKAAKK